MYRRYVLVFLMNRKRQQSYWLITILILICVKNVKFCLSINDFAFNLDTKIVKLYNEIIKIEKEIRYEKNWNYDTCYIIYGFRYA